MYANLYILVATNIDGFLNEQSNGRLDFILFIIKRFLRILIEGHIHTSIFVKKNKHRFYYNKAKGAVDKI